MKTFKSIIRTVATLVVAVSMVTANVSAATVSSSTSAEISAQPTAIERSKTVTASKTLGVNLGAGESGYSNTLDFNFNTLPSNANVTKIEIKVGSFSTAGDGVVLADPVTVIAPDGTKYVFTWRAGLTYTITDIQNLYSQGIWQMYFYGTNLSSRYWASLLYSRTSITIYYT